MPSLSLVHKVRALADSIPAGDGVVLNSTLHLRIRSFQVGEMTPQAVEPTEMMGRCKVYRSPQMRSCRHP